MHYFNIFALLLFKFQTVYRILVKNQIHEPEH